MFMCIENVLVTQLTHIHVHVCTCIFRTCLHDNTTKLGYIHYCSAFIVCFTVFTQTQISSSNTINTCITQQVLETSNDTQ